MRRLVLPLLALAIAGCRGCNEPATSAPDAARASDATAAGDATAADAADADADASAHVGTTHADLAAMFAAHPDDLRTLDDVPQFLPAELRSSFVLKHGRVRTGERGHLVEKRVSQSADPDAPRAILWDHRTGFVVSYNGGLATQSHGQRLDIHSFDETTKSFVLESVDFPLPAPGKPEFQTNGDCGSCHGPRLRPIFSMYPDWPSFYGSDNDELSNPKVAVQVAELADYRHFRDAVTKSHLPRYAVLFQTPDASETFPYRPDVSEDIHAVSRAFAHRPGLRLGIVLNRLQARALVATIEKHPRFEKLGRAFLSNLVGCGAGVIAATAGESPSLALDATVRPAIEEALGGPPKVVGNAKTGTTLDYRQLWKLFDLEVRDVDIRYAYPNEGYASNDATKNPMAVGYIGTYWNSYFDGSATIDELVAYALYQELARVDPALAGVVTPDGLVAKYEHLTDRFALDREFFTSMDDKGRWLPIPYPRTLDGVHHREGYGPTYVAQHRALCAALAKPTK